MDYYALEVVSALKTMNFWRTIEYSAIFQAFRRLTQAKYFKRSDFILLINIFRSSFEAKEKTSCRFMYHIAAKYRAKSWNDFEFLFIFFLLRRTTSEWIIRSFPINFKDRSWSWKLKWYGIHPTKNWWGTKDEKVLLW